MSLEYAREGGWRGGRITLSREEALRYIYDLFEYESQKRFLVAGVGIDSELRYVKKIADDSSKFIYISQPDKEIAKKLREELRRYRNVEIIEDYTYRIGRHLHENSVDYICALNIVNWRPQHFLSLIKNMYKILKPTGYCILSFYVYISPDAKDKKYIIETPKRIIDIFNSFFKPIIHYEDCNGILAVYKLSKNDLKQVYRKLSELREEIRPLVMFLL